MADNGTKIRTFFLQKQGLTVLETIGTQVVSPFSKMPRLWSGIGRDKRFFLIQNAQAGSGAQPFLYLAHAGVLSAGRPTWAYSWEAEVKIEWNYKSTATLCFHGVERNNFTYYISLWDSWQSALTETRFNNWNQPWASSNAAKFQANYAEIVRQKRDHVVLLKKIQYVCDNTFVYKTNFVQNPKWVNISCAILYTRKPNMGYANCNAMNMPVKASRLRSVQCLCTGLYRRT